jgi:hypothetical protein
LSSITDQILGAWDSEEQAPTEESAEETAPVETTLTDAEDQDEVAAADEVEDDEKTPEEEGEVLVETGEEVEAEEPSQEEEPEAPSGDEEEQPAASVSDDPEIEAYLARHGGSVESALKAAVSGERVLGRQGRELGQLRQRTAELEAQMEEAALFSQGGALITAEQAEWVEEAVGSEQPLAYIQSAIQAGEFDLARAVLERGEFNAYQAMRLAQGIDQAQGRAQTGPVEPDAPLNHQALMTVLVEHYPEMPSYETEMVSTISMLGADHPLVALAQSQDPGEAAQGIIGVYEIARAKTATVASTRDGIKTKRRQAADDVRRSAQVSSAQATNATAQTPRSRPLMPGLTLEALEAEFDTE